MPDDKIKRRDALARLATMLAAASGLSAAQTVKVNEGIQRTITPLKAAQLEKLAKVKASSLNAKVLKGLLFNRRDIFLSEFGRIPGDLITNPSFGGLGCDFFFAVGGSTCEDQNCGGMVGCNDNNCTEQRCGRFTNCGTNNCGNQHKATNFDVAGCGAHTDIFSTNFLTSVMRDPFIQSLMKEANITTSAQLSAQLQSMLLGKQSTAVIR